MAWFGKAPLKHLRYLHPEINPDWLDYLEQRNAEGDYFQKGIAFILEQDYTDEVKLRLISYNLEHKRSQDIQYEEEL